MMNLGRVGEGVGPARLGLVVALLLAPASVASAQAFTGRVVGVSDGDTIRVLRDRTEVRVRLNGIDCPETGQDFGSRAKSVTSSLAFGQVVKVIPKETDRYGRIVADVVLPDGRALNEELVRQGMAWWYRHYARNIVRLAQLESEAKAARRGLWSQPNPVPPWEWRHEKQAVPAELEGKVLANSRSHVHHVPGCANAAKISTSTASRSTRRKRPSGRVIGREHGLRWRRGSRLGGVREL